MNENKISNKKISTSIVIAIFISILTIGLSFGLLKNTNNKSDNEDKNINKNYKEDKAVANNTTKKTDKPLIELFVMSHCPYGLQMEKGILPVLKTLNDKIDFNLKFTTYAMHGEKELKEQLSQYCIQKEQKDKLISYLECFVKDGENGSDSCINGTNIDKDKLNSCITQTEKEYKVLSNFNSKRGFKGNYPGFDIFKSDNERYGVNGSPTLVINGDQSKSERDSKSLLRTICSAFNNEPAECSTDMSSDAPAPGFGGVASSNNSSAGGCH